MPLPWIDGHLDLACFAVEGRDLLARCEKKASECISVPDLEASPIRTIFGTIYTAPQDDATSEDPCEYADPDSAFSVGLRQLEVYEQLEQEGLISIQHDELRVPSDDEPLGVYLLMEGADPIRNPDDVAWWHDRGLRMVGLTWSRGTRYAGGNASGEGLSKQGRELVAAMDERGITHDASHCSDNALEDLFSCARGTIVATHSNSRAILGGENQRHLRDDHAKEILRRGGVIGLNLFSKFLAHGRRATTNDCVEHIHHFCELAGNRTQVALGSDYDGGFTTEELPIGLEHPDRLPTLLRALAKSGFRDEELAGFAHDNWLRCLNPSNSR